VKYSTYFISSKLKIDYQFFLPEVFPEIFNFAVVEVLFNSYKKNSFIYYNTKGKKCKP